MLRRSNLVGLAGCNVLAAAMAVEQRHIAAAVFCLAVAIGSAWLWWTTRPTFGRPELTKRDVWGDDPRNPWSDP